MTTLKSIKGILLVAFVLIATGSGLAQVKQHFGAAIDSKAQKVTLAELIAKPDSFAGKMVVVEGIHDGACADGDDFYFKDKFDLIEAVPPTPEVMKLKKGTHVRLYGVVKVRHSGETEVRIVAKGIDVL